MTLALSTGITVALVVLVALDIFAIVFGLWFARANKAAKAKAAGLEEPPKPVKAVSRRDFFRRSLLVSLAVFGAQFGGATLAFLWPNLKGGFGSLINAGPLADIKARDPGHRTAGVQRHRTLLPRPVRRHAVRRRRLHG